MDGRYRGWIHAPWTWRRAATHRTAAVLALLPLALLLLHRRRPDARSSHLYIVDCGSRGSRVYRFPRRGPPVGEKLLELGALHDLLATDRGGPSFVARLSDALPPGADAFVGGTGGMRDALERGSVGGERVSAFADALRARVPGASFAVLSGAQEAHLERVAVAAAADAADGAAGTARPLTVLSLGGASTQIATDWRVLSADLGIRYAMWRGQLVEWRSILRAPGTPARAAAEWRAVVEAVVEAFLATAGAFPSLGAPGS